MLQLWYLPPIFSLFCPWNTPVHAVLSALVMDLVPIGPARGFWPRLASRLISSRHRQRDLLPVLFNRRPSVHPFRIASPSAGPDSEFAYQYDTYMTSHKSIMMATIGINTETINSLYCMFNSRLREDGGLSRLAPSFSLF
ncbi:hypothetical protein F5Y16DRAFT_371381 [Xylariaceae sp. FL0255]|nr:hypothetical protein F5Y16DRAFT_371381 [Xylariaceae sp. FL0255]